MKKLQTTIDTIFGISHILLVNIFENKANRSIIMIAVGPSVNPYIKGCFPIFLGEFLYQN